MSHTFNDILKVQREQLDDTEKKLRYIAANAELLILRLHKKVHQQNADMDYNKSPLDEVFRGYQLDGAINGFIEEGLKDDGDDWVGGISADGMHRAVNKVTGEVVVTDLGRNKDS